MTPRISTAAESCFSMLQKWYGKPPTSGITLNMIFFSLECVLDYHASSMPGGTQTPATCCLPAIHTSHESSLLSPGSLLTSVCPNTLSKSVPTTSSSAGKQSCHFSTCLLRGWPGQATSSQSSSCHWFAVLGKILTPLGLGACLWDD